MITLTLNAETLADLKAQMVAILGYTVPLCTPEVAPVAEKPKTTTRKAAEPKAEEPKAEEPAAEAAADDTPALNFNTDVAPLVVSTVEKYGKPVVVEVLTQFGAGKASEVPEAQWPELLIALKDAAANATPLAA